MDNETMAPVLTNETLRVNLAEITGHIKDFIWDDVDFNIDFYIEVYCERTDKDFDMDIWEAFSVNYQDMFTEGASFLPEIVMNSIDGLEEFLQFGEVDTTKVSPSHDLMMAPDYVPVDVTVTDAEALVKFWQEETGKKDIRDGYHISGFYRTCSDERWSLAEIIRDLLDKNYDEYLDQSREYYRDLSDHYLTLNFELPEE